jgi:hypothetical protein
MHVRWGLSGTDDGDTHCLRCRDGTCRSWKAVPGGAHNY